MLRIVVDTNIWIRTLLGGQVSLPVLQALKENRFQLLISDALLAELETVVKRPRLATRMATQDIDDLLAALLWHGELVELRTIPPRCRDPKDHPVLATAIDGRADAIVSGDGDLRADDELRASMAAFGIDLWGVQTFLHALHA
ncbi:MAG: putative toxin-antitoxin system toxin component, PIN family [Caldilineaceae bacterium]|nr:putative toxin-antitoxin system toxin component, PIN family [Caldilineaceae bacterium]